MKNKKVSLSITAMLYVLLTSMLFAQNIPYTLPQNFPGMEVSGHTQNPEGYYFMHTFGTLPDHDSVWIMIVDTTALPVYYNMFHGIITNFTLQEETGTLTYWSWNDSLFFEMDSSYNVINTYTAKNGYIPDGHELILKADGSYWIMALDPQIVDMSQIVEGGNPNALVIGFIIQHVGNDGNVIFEWKSWDHFDILDADTNLVDFTAQRIDYVHGNALGFDSDTTVLLSSRCMNEITKINTNTGDIVWRWGGKHNMFTCTNAPTIPYHFWLNTIYAG